MSPDTSRNPANDLVFDAEQLRAKYDGLAEDSEWGEHLNHPMEEWQTEVHYKNTRVGYWDWVVTKLKIADDKNDKDPTLADAEEKEIVELQADDPGNQGA
jgi:hypothetical protein